MPEGVTIKERIERQVAVNLATITGVVSVKRWDGRDAVSLVPYQAFTIVDDQKITEGPGGSIGWHEVTLSLSAGVLLLHSAADATESSAAVLNRWIGRLLINLTADPMLIEAVTGVRLVTDVRITGTRAPDWDDGRFAAVVDCEIDYRTLRTNPCQGIVAQVNE